MADAVVTTTPPFSATIWRLVRTAVAMGLPILISWLSGRPNVMWAGLAPVITAFAKWIRDNFKGWDWLPV